MTGTPPANRQTVTGATGHWRRHRGGRWWGSPPANSSSAAPIPGTSMCSSPSLGPRCIPSIQCGADLPTSNVLAHAVLSSFLSLRYPFNHTPLPSPPLFVFEIETKQAIARNEQDDCAPLYDLRTTTTTNETKACISGGKHVAGLFPPILVSLFAFPLPR